MPLVACGECETEKTKGYCSKIERIVPKTYSDVQSCSDGNCIIKKPKGMHTNGGCDCLKEFTWKGAEDYPCGSIAEMAQIIRCMRDEIERLQTVIETKETAK